MSAPLGLALLFLMAVAPVLPWRRASTELLSQRLWWPAVTGVGFLVVAVALGAHGLAPLVGFALGGFALGSAVRQLVLSVRRHGIAGVFGRSNGGMVVHIGVVFIAIALAASQSYVRQTELRLVEGQTATFAGHTFTYVGTNVKLLSNREISQVLVEVDGAGPYAPGVSRFDFGSQQVGTPSVRVTPTTDIALSVLALPDEPGGPTTVRITVQPLIVWLWIGGGVMVAGTFMAAAGGLRGRRRDGTATSVADVEVVT
jgi:cytochrome c-type biogenesis protein CcmF